MQLIHQPSSSASIHQRIDFGPSVPRDRYPPFTQDTFGCRSYEVTGRQAQESQRTSCGSQERGKCVVARDLRAMIEDPPGWTQPLPTK